MNTKTSETLREEFDSDFTESWEEPTREVNENGDICSHYQRYEFKNHITPDIVWNWINKNFIPRSEVEMVLEKTRCGTFDANIVLQQLLNSKGGDTSSPRSE